MYPVPSSSCSSSHKSLTSSTDGLFRYGSAPGSLLTIAVDSVIGASPNSAHPHPTQPPHHLRPPPAQSPLGQYYSADSSSVTSESTCKVNSASRGGGCGGLQRPVGFSELTMGGGGSSSSSSLVRQKSSPAGFLGHLTDVNGELGISNSSTIYPFSAPTPNFTNSCNYYIYWTEPPTSSLSGSLSSYIYQGGPPRPTRNHYAVRHLIY